LRRGFKTEAEARAASARVVFDLSPLAPVDPWAYAKHLGILVLDFKSLELSEKSSRHLLVTDSSSWSAMTLKEGKTIAIVLNPSHARTRRCNDLMHEVAHIELKHQPNRVDVSRTGLLLLSDYSEEQELEADWLAATILLPRNVLVSQRRRGHTIEQIATAYGVSEDLCEWRLRMTAVDVQIRRTSRG
jgi:Zn-dependent peptidase ImmA (M78 family)